VGLCVADLQRSFREQNLLRVGRPALVAGEVPKQATAPGRVSGLLPGSAGADDLRGGKGSQLGQRQGAQALDLGPYRE